jgi:hypothetical protein
MLVEGDACDIIMLARYQQLTLIRTENQLQTNKKQKTENQPDSNYILPFPWLSLEPLFYGYKIKISKST